MPMNLAMWSGPRNISTAMMRAWENRSDCTVWDEPFYAYFLQQTGIDHPLAAEVINAYDKNLDSLIAKLSTRPKSGIAYQKHISTHILDHMPLDWLQHVTNVFLIREPKYMVASYTQKRVNMTASDFGYTQLEMLFKKAASAQGSTPLVIDSRRFLRKPEAHLRFLCQHLNIEFESAMLTWPSGSRDSDGLWHTHWYDSVKASTGFGPPREGESTLNAHQQAIADECQPHFDTLNAHAIDP